MQVPGVICNTVIFEGYDGSGKSSLIRRVREICVGATIRVIGRKAEPELESISNAIEDDKHLLVPSAELLLRIALEMVRLELVDRALETGNLVFLDRGVVSLTAWFDYYGVAPEAYHALLSNCRSRLDGAITVACMADFDTCWERVEQKEQKSKKERLGKQQNRIYYDRYMRHLRALAGRGGVICVDTAGQDLDASAYHVVEHLARNGVRGCLKEDGGQLQPDG